MMLSPGQWHKSIPKGRAENLRWRIRLLEAVRKYGAPARQAVFKMCREDILFYINGFVFQYNPDHVGEEVGPFISWDFQEEAILKTLRILIQERDDMLWEKSRMMGATWMALIIDDWLCTFHDYKKCL